MGKTIRFGENSLIAIKNKLNEIMAGSDDIVSHNDVGGKVKLYHGTTIDALLMIMESGVMSAKRGKQHGETYGVNWFSLKNGDNFNKGVLFSIEVPGNIFNERFRMMNSSEAVSKDDDLDITGFNLTIEKICGLSREAIKNAYDRYVSNGDRYPLESIGYLFDHFIEKVQDDDVLFPSILYHNWDKYYPMIMKNILGDNINESVAKEFAPVTEIGAEPNSPAGGTFHHMEQEQTDEDSLTEGKIPQQFIDNAIKLRPDRYHNWVVIDLVDIGRMPRYFEKKEFAREYYRWLGRGVENSPVLVNLDKLGSLTEGIKFDQHGLSFNDDKILKKYNLKDLILSKAGKYVTLNKIVANELGKGNGSRFMEELTKIADDNGWILVLTPDTSFGGSSVGRLKKFYKRFGFVPNKGRSTDFNTRESMIRRPLGENNDSELMGENVEKEVESSEVDLSSFKKRDTLPPGIWKDEETLNSKVRLKLLDIADDFWKFVNLTWVEPKGIIITGSICNFNWSKFSDIDLHLVVDFNEIDSKTEFVKQYLDSKKNEWNAEHEGLKIMGFPVELYTQDVSDNVEAGGIYDLEENAWIRRPNPHTIKSIGLEKFDIKRKAAEIMTIIDEMYKTLSSTDDGYEVSKIGEDASYLWEKVKSLRKKSLTKRGENGAGNIVYKVLRRTGYLDKLFKLFSATYDKSNSISESLIREEFDLLGAAKNFFGTTNDLRECGFILPDGSMLDLSGGQSGRRTVQHRSIESLENENTPTISLSRFVEAGAIRCDLRGGFINLIKRPTKEQIYVLSRFITKCGGCVQVDIGDDDISIDYVEYDGVNYRRIINDILNFFDNKIKPSSLYESKDPIVEGVQYDRLRNDQVFRYRVIADMVKDGYVFHGTGEDGNGVDWDTVDPSKIKGGSRGTYGYGIYFSDHAYKCEKYAGYSGGHFIIANIKDFNLINLRDKIDKEHNIFVDKQVEYHKLYDALNNARNSMEYDIISSKIDEYKETVDKELLYEITRIIDKSDGDITYGYLNENIPLLWYMEGDSRKRVSNLYLSLGIDGFAVDTEFVLFNFDKLNNAIVKNKEELLLQYVQKAGLSESTRKYLNVLKEEFAMDGSSEGNPYEKRWKAERDALKNFVANYGKLMQSKEDNKQGRLYKVYYDETMSNLIGYNYCICVQWDEMTMKPKSTVYIRALDKFTPFIRRNLQFDDRGLDNQRGTTDDIRY